MPRRLRHRSRLLLLSAFGALSVTTTASASPWAREDDRLFIATRADYFIAIADVPIPPVTSPPRFERFETHTYVEFGLTSRTMIGGKFIYGTSNYDDGFVRTDGSGFSEVEAFVQREVLRNKQHALSFSLAGAAPMRLETGVRPGLHSNGADLEARVLYGRDLIAKPFKVYATTEAGYRRRFGASADQIQADFLLGVEPTNDFLILAQVFSTISLRNEDVGGADYDVVKIQPSIVWRVSRRWSLQAGVTREAAGRNLLLGDAYFFGFWTVF